MKFLIFALALSSICFAEEEEAKVSVSSVKRVVIGQGGKAEALLTATVKKGFHIQANPASQPQLIATEFEVTSDKGVEAGVAIYPKPKPYKVTGLGMEIATYTGRFSIRVPLSAAANAGIGQRDLIGKFRYQACDDQVCFPPVSQPVTVPVKISKP
jgi:hypothetical protein